MLPRRLQEPNLYEWPPRIVVEDERRQHHPQIAEIVGRLGK